jgi:hypothetical protein
MTFALYDHADVLGITITMDKKTFAARGEGVAKVPFGWVTLPVPMKVVSSVVDKETILLTRSIGNLAFLTATGYRQCALLALDLAKMDKPEGWLEKMGFKRAQEVLAELDKRQAVVGRFYRNDASLDWKEVTQDAAAVDLDGR